MSFGKEISWEYADNNNVTYLLSVWLNILWKWSTFWLTAGLGCRDSLNRAIDQLPKKLAMQARSRRGRGGWGDSSPPLLPPDCGPCDFYSVRHSALMALNVLTCCMLWIITVWGRAPPPLTFFLATGLWWWLLRQRVDMLNFARNNHPSVCLLSSYLLHFE